MFLLFGEAKITKTLGRTELNCVVCGKMRAAQRFAEVSYFTLFLIPLLPLNRLSDYWECSGCGEAYASRDSLEPASAAVIRRLLVYMLLGYGGSARRESMREILAHTTGSDIDHEQITQESRLIEEGGFAIFDFLKDSTYHLNSRARGKIVEAAFLMTHASCEIQQQDRARINLIGGALGLSSAQIDGVIDRVRSARYYGVRRNLKTVSSVSR